jgi:SRSO17 transposase
MQITTTEFDLKLLESWRATLIDSGNIDRLLADYAELFYDEFDNKNQSSHFLHYLRGLMSELPRKSVEPIALALYGEKGVRSLQQYLKRSTFSDNALLCRYRDLAAARLSSQNGMLSVDGSDFEKAGKNSAGVGRQYCGSLGKVENCQAGVFAAYASSAGYALLDRELY